MTHQHIAIERRERVAIVTVDRPDKLNALNRATLEELHAAFDALADDESARAIVLTGRGDKAFVAGADIAEIREQTPVDARRFSALGQRLMRSMETMEKPVLAAINGFALGGGLELAMGCHLRYAASNARLGLPEIKLGLLPGFGGTQRLPRLIGRGPALALMLSGEPIDAERARALGLVQEVTEPGAVVDHAVAHAERLAHAAPEAVRAILASVDAGLDMPLEAGLAFETAQFAICCATDDMREGTSAFLEKRRPTFSGR